MRKKLKSSSTLLIYAWYHPKGEAPTFDVQVHSELKDPEWADEWEAATKEILQLVKEDKVRYRETITKGFENAPQALRDVLTGKNFGKQIIEI